MKYPYLAAILIAVPMCSFAAEDGKKPVSQHERMANCSKDAHAKGLKGEERKKFMSECLSSGKAAKAPHQGKSPA